jgi:hypothetical protein
MTQFIEGLIGVIKALLSFFGIFFLAFVAQMIICHYYAPPPTPDDFDHPEEQTGSYWHYVRARGDGDTWLGGIHLYCEVSAIKSMSCYHSDGLPAGATVTAEVVSLKTLLGNKTIAMSIKSDSRRVFQQTPQDVIEAWKSANYFWFAAYSFLCAMASLVLIGIVSALRQ